MTEPGLARGRGGGRERLDRAAGPEARHGRRGLGRRGLRQDRPGQHRPEGESGDPAELHDGTSRGWRWDILAPRGNRQHREYHDGRAVSKDSARWRAKIVYDGSDGTGAPVTL